MLTNLLPGLRDLRTPLATGYLYLVAAWIFFGDLVPEKAQATGLIAQLYDLNAAAGITTLLAAVSFVAFVIGTIFSVGTEGAVIWSWRRASRLFIKYYDPSTPPLGSQFLSAVTAISQEALDRAESHNLTSKMIDRATQPDDLRRGIQVMYNGSNTPRNNSWTLMEDTIYREIPAIAARLLEKNKDLFDRYDRLRSEAEFRHGIAIPLALCLLALAIKIQDIDIVYRLLIIAAGVALLALLTFKGKLKYIEAMTQLAQALLTHIVKPPAIERVDALIPPHMTLEEASAAERIAMEKQCELARKRRRMSLSGATLDARRVNSNRLVVNEMIP